MIKCSTLPQTVSVTVGWGGSIPTAANGQDSFGVNGWNSWFGWYIIWGGGNGSSLYSYW